MYYIPLDPFYWPNVANNSIISGDVHHVNNYFNQLLLHTKSDIIHHGWVSNWYAVEPITEVNIRQFHTAKKVKIIGPLKTFNDFRYSDWIQLLTRLPELYKDVPDKMRDQPLRLLASKRQHRHFSF